MQNQEYIIQMKDIRKEYFGNPVLKGVNLNVKKGCPKSLDSLFFTFY